MEQLSFEAWVRPRMTDLLRFAYLVTGSSTAAQDAVQSALTTAFERWDTITEHPDVDAYVRRMITNAHISAWRRFGKRQTPVAAPAGGRDHADHAASVAEQDAVWRVCATLPPQQRAAVVLRFYEDLDYDEIASVLQCRPATVRSHIHRALTALRAQLAQDAVTSNNATRNDVTPNDVVRNDLTEDDR